MNLPHDLHAGKTRIREHINQLLPFLAGDDQHKFAKKFRNETGEQLNHTFRELILGTFLIRNEFMARYDVSINGKTPDWLLYGSNGDVLGIVDQLTFHQAKELDDEMNAAMKARSASAYWAPDNTERLYSKIYAKAETYESLAATHNTSNIVSVFGDFNAAVEFDELHDVLHKSHEGGIFSRLPLLSGVIYFQEEAGIYHFKYLENPLAVYPLHIAEGQI